MPGLAWLLAWLAERMICKASQRLDSQKARFPAWHFKMAAPSLSTHLNCSYHTASRVALVAMVALSAQRCVSHIRRMLLEREKHPSQSFPALPTISSIEPCKMTSSMPCLNLSICPRPCEMESFNRPLTQVVASFLLAEPSLPHTMRVMFPVTDLCSTPTLIGNWNHEIPFYGLCPMKAKSSHPKARRANEANPTGSRAHLSTPAAICSRNTGSSTRRSGRMVFSWPSSGNLWAHCHMQTCPVFLRQASRDQN